MPGIVVCAACLSGLLPMQIAFGLPQGRAGSWIWTSPVPDGATVTRHPRLLPRVVRAARVTVPPSTLSNPFCTVR